MGGTLLGCKAMTCMGVGEAVRSISNAWLLVARWMGCTLTSSFYRWIIQYWGCGPPRRKYGEHMVMLVEQWDICWDLLLKIAVRAQDGMEDWCALLIRRKAISGMLTSPEVDTSGLMRPSELGLLPIRWI